MINKGLSTRQPTNIELYYAGCGHNSPPRKACGSGYIKGIFGYFCLLDLANAFSL